jgi:hypothetical protein
MAKATTTIDKPVANVWRALVTPETINRYMFGATVVSDWREGSPIVWRGEWKGKPYEDKGEIVRIEPGRMLRYTHWSPLSGLPDLPEKSPHGDGRARRARCVHAGVAIAGRQPYRRGAGALRRELEENARRSEEGRRERLTRRAQR